MTGIGGVAGPMGPAGPVGSEDDDDLPLDLSDEGEDEFADDLGGVGEEPAGDLGDGGLDFGEGGGGQDALEVSCPDCGSAITVKLVPEVESGESDELDLGEGPDVDLDVEGGLEEGPPEEGLGPDVHGECYESVNPSVIAKLLTDDPDIFTR